jgi:hypothetical protein
MTVVKEFSDNLPDTAQGAAVNVGFIIPWHAVKSVQFA